MNTIPSSTTPRRQKVLLFAVLLVGLASFAAIASTQILPYYETGFEAADGYAPGSLDGQDGWSVDAGAASVTVDTQTGTQSVWLHPGQPRTRLSRDFTEFTEEDVVFVDFNVRGGAGEPPSNAPEASSPETFHVAIAAEDDLGRFYVFSGDGVGSGSWVPTVATVPLDTNGQLLDWANVTVRLDFVRQSFDFYLNGTIAGFDYGFLLDGQQHFHRFALSGNPGMEVMLDDFYAGPVSLAWNNEARDGIPDWWKLQNGLALDQDIRDDIVDGKRNIERFFTESGFEGEVGSGDAYLVMSLGAGEGEVIFFDDFESEGLGNWSTWAGAAPLAVSTAQNVTPGGQNSAVQSNSNQKMSHTFPSSVSGAFRTTFWIYDDMGEQTRWFGEVRTGFSQIFAIGRHSTAFSGGTGELAGETVNPGKYQARVLSGQNAGWFNLSGAANRSPGWRKFEIERLADGTTINFYVDGVLGRTISGATYHPVSALTIGAGVGTTPGNAWFDDVEMVSFSPPTIVQEPEALTLNIGETAIFSVQVASTSAVQYRWLKDGVPLTDDGRIQGSNSQELTIRNVMPNDHHRYTVEVTNRGGTAKSSAAWLAVNGYTSFTDDFEDGALENWTVFSGAANLSASTARNHTLGGSYSAAVSSSSNRVFHEFARPVEGRSRVTFWVYDDRGSQNRVLGEIRGTDPLQVLSIGWYNTNFATDGLNGESVDSTKYQGRVLTGSNTGWFNLNAPGAPNRTVGWRKFEIERLDDGTTVNFYVDGFLGRSITGVTDVAWESIVIGSIGFGSTSGSAWFDDVKVEHFHPPVLPGHQSVEYGRTVEFTAGVSASEGLTFTWLKNGAALTDGGNVVGANTDTLTIFSADLADEGRYSVLISNGTESIESVIALLSVNMGIIFFDDFEYCVTGDPGNNRPLEDRWRRLRQENSNSQARVLQLGPDPADPANQTAKLIDSDNRMYANLDWETQAPARATFWIYDDLGEQTRWFGEVRGYVGEGFHNNNNNLEQVLAIGRYDVAPNSNLNYYQARVSSGANTGWFNLDGPDAPKRTAGWRKFEILRKADGSTIEFYVDGILARTVTGARQSNWDFVAVGSSADEKSAGVRPGNAWFDNVKVERLDVPDHCALYPIAIPMAAVQAGTTVQLSPGTGSTGNFDWLTWNGDTSTGRLEQSLRQADSYHYTSPVAGGSDSIAEGSWILKSTNTLGQGIQRTLSDHLICPGREIRVVLWDQTQLSGSNRLYRVGGFATVVVTAVSGNTVTFSLVAHDACGPIEPPPTIIHFDGQNPAAQGAVITADPNSGQAPYQSQIEWQTQNAGDVFVTGPDLSSTAPAGSESVTVDDEGVYSVAAWPVEEALLSWSVANATSLILHAPGQHYVKISGKSVPNVQGYYFYDGEQNGHPSYRGEIAGQSWFIRWDWAYENFVLTDGGAYLWQNLTGTVEGTYIPEALPSEPEGEVIGALTNEPPSQLDVTGLSSTAVHRIGDWTLEAQGSGGIAVSDPVTVSWPSPATASALVTVDPTTPAPVIHSFDAANPETPTANIWANPASGVAPFDTTVFWSSEHAVSTTVSGFGIDSNNPAGSESVRLSQQEEYIILATGGEEAQLSWSVSDAAIVRLQGPGFDEDVTALSGITVYTEGFWTLVAQGPGGTTDDIVEVVFPGPANDSALVTLQPKTGDLAVDVGPDRLISLPTTVTLAPEVSSPVGEVVAPVTYLWTAETLDGAGEAAFDDPHALEVMVSFTLPGQYRLTLMAADGEGKAGEDYLDVNVLPAPVSPESPVATSEGFDFWVTFLRNHDMTGINELVISAAEGASGIIIENIPEFSSEGDLIGTRVETTYFEATAALPYRFLPEAYNNDVTFMERVLQPGVPMSSSIRIQTDRPITVHGLAADSFTTDGFLALPTPLLGTEYVLSSYDGLFISQPPGAGLGTFSITATEDNTECVITPSVPVRGDDEVFAEGVAFTMVLQAGEVLRFDADGIGDLTGTRVSANKPVAVLSGAMCVYVPTGFPACDTIVDQLLPVDLWGSNYVVMPMQEPGEYPEWLCEVDPWWGQLECNYSFDGDEVLLIAREWGQTTTVWLDGAPIASLDHGETHRQVIQGSGTITSDGWIDIYLLSDRYAGDVVRIIADEDDTTVSINGLVVASLNAGEFHEEIVSDPSSIVADKPVQVTQFMAGTNFRQRPMDGYVDNDDTSAIAGDPLMVLVPAIEQFGTRLQFHAFARDYSWEPEPFAHFVGLIVPQTHLNELIINGTPINQLDVLIPKQGPNGWGLEVVAATDLFVPIADTDYIGANIPVEEGYNLIQSDKPFFGIGWGVYPYESYGFRGSIAVDQPMGELSLQQGFLPPAALIGEEQEVSVRVVNALGNPIGGVAVKFKIDGVHAGELTALSDANGWARIAYTGSSAGPDIIVATLRELSVQWLLDWRLDDPNLNAAPGVEIVGGDREVFAAELVNFTAVVSDDGLPNPPGEVTVRWDILGGFAGVTLLPEFGTDTTVTFPLPGTYRVRAMASDGELETKDEVVVTVKGGSSVQMVSPRRNSVHSMSTWFQSVTIPLRAEAASDEGISSVEFFLQGPGDQAPETQVGPAMTAAPFTHNHTINNAGAYSVRAKLTNQLNEEFYSDPVSFLVVEGLAISFDSPTSSELPVYYPDPVPVEVTVQGGFPPYYVKFQQGQLSNPGELLAQFLDAGPYSFDWENPYSYPNDQRIVSALVVDSMGQIATETRNLANQIRVESTPEIVTPVAEVRLPSGHDYDFRVRVHDPDGVSNVQFFLDSTSIGTVWQPAAVTDTTADYVLTYQLPAPSGSQLQQDFILEAQLRQYNGGRVTTSDPVTFTIVDSQQHAPPVVELGPNPSPVFPGLPLPLPCPDINPAEPYPDAYIIVHPDSDLTFVWTIEDGPPAFFDDATEACTAITFVYAGTYVVRLTVDDGIVSHFDEITVSVVVDPNNNPPQLQAWFPPSPIDAGPAGASDYAEAQASDPDNDPLTIDFFLWETGEPMPATPVRSMPADNNELVVWNFEGLAPGDHEFMVRARDDRGGLATAGPVTVTVTRVHDPDLLRITSPEYEEAVSGLVDIQGHARLTDMTGWRVEYRPSAKPGELPADWMTVPGLTGTWQVGWEGWAGSFGTFDPSLLRNGFYDLRVVAEFASEPDYPSNEVRILIDGLRKVGHFAIAFQDLTVPFAGLSIDVIRSYDTRDSARQGDFGRGWTLGVNGVDVRKNRPLGVDWYYSIHEAGFMGTKVYSLDPASAPGGTSPVRHLITLSLPDDTIHTFEAAVVVEGGISGFMGSEFGSNQSFLVPIEKVNFVFRPATPRTRGTLRIDGPAGSNEAWLVEGREVGGGPVVLRTDYSYSAPVFNPTRFIYTSDDGTQYRVSEEDGLEKITDTVGNELTIVRGAGGRIDRIEQGSPARAIEFNRDGDGRIDYIEDLYGAEIHYDYLNENLVKVTDRAGAETEFTYYNDPPDSGEEHLSHFLKEIFDAKGELVFFNDYDSEGRLIRQTDARDNAVEFDRSVQNREKITDRLGYETLHWYDAEGNITQTQLPVAGGSVSISYQFNDPANPNAVTRRTDPGNIVTEFTYDSAGRLLEQKQAAVNPITNQQQTLSTRNTYDSRGNPLTTTDAEGNKTVYTYYRKGDPGTPDAWDGLPHTITDAENNVTEFLEYDSRGNLLRMKDALGNETVTVYDAFDRLESETDASGAVTSYVYDDHGRVQFERRNVTPSGGGAPVTLETEFGYDGEGRLLWTRHPDGSVSGTEYDENGMPQFVYEPEFDTGQFTFVPEFDFSAFSRKTTHEYENGNLIRTTYPPVTIEPFEETGSITETYTEEWVYDAEDRRILAKDKEDRWTRSYYDPLGRLIATYHLGIMSRAAAIASPVGAGTLLSANAYDPLGRMTDSYDARGFRTHYKYDNAGRRTHVVPPGGTPAIIGLNEDGDKLVFARQGTIDENRQTVSVYDRVGNVIEVRDAEGRVTEYRYDRLNRRVLTIYSGKSRVSQIYDGAGRKIAETDAEGKLTRFRYDPMGRLLEVRQYLDQLLARGDEALDPALIGDPDVVSTRFEYDELGRQIRQIDAEGRTTRYVYDAMGRRQSRELPLGQVESYAYRADGNLRSRTDFNGETTIYRYDSLGRLVERRPSAAARNRITDENWVGAWLATFTYTPNGQRASQALWDNEDSVAWWATYEYDEFGHLALKTTPDGEIDYIHDAAGNLLLTAAVSGDVETETHYGYDSLGRLHRVDDRTAVAAGRVTEYRYTASGALERVTLPNGVVTRYDYNEANRLLGIEARLNVTTLARFGYDLRLGGHRSRLTERIGASQIHGSARVTNWEYDDLYRLTGEAIAGGTGDPASAVGTFGYTYDKVGNRESRTASGGAGTVVPPVGDYGYDANDRLRELDQVLAYDHDANGNTTWSQSGGSVIDIYDEANRLLRRTYPNGWVVTILYDADGNRIRKIATDQEGVYHESRYLVDTLNPTGYAQVLVERKWGHDDSGGFPFHYTSSTVYTYGLDRISQTQQDGTTHYYGYDGLGSVRYLTNVAGGITDRYYYDAFGNLLDAPGSGTDNQYLYAGEQWDEDLGLYYNRARYMAPSIGRFWTMDEFEGVNATPASLHKYLYAHADPVNGRDPSGYFTLTMVSATTSFTNTLNTINLSASNSVLRFAQNQFGSNAETDQLINILHATEMAINIANVTTLGVSIGYGGYKLTQFVVSGKAVGFIRSLKGGAGFADDIPRNLASPYLVRIDLRFPGRPHPDWSVDTSTFHSGKQLADGGVRNARLFWKGWYAKRADTLSSANRQRALAGESPIIDDTWIKYYPEHAPYRGQKMIHHHEPQGSSWAIPVPADTHIGSGGPWHGRLLDAMN